MDEAGSLQNLNDIVVPAAVDWWPLAPGWYVLFAVLTVVLAVLAFRRWRRWQRDRYRRLALEELAAIHSGGREATRIAASDLPALLKRTALSAWPRADVAALTGPAWHRFLDQSAGMNQFCSGAGTSLDLLSYGSSGAEELPDAELLKLLDAARIWLKSHQVREEEH